MELTKLCKLDKNDERRKIYFQTRRELNVRSVLLSRRQMRSSSITARKASITDSNYAGYSGRVPLSSGRTSDLCCRYKIGVTEAKAYSVATFYENFSFEPKGKYVIKVCDGTACHVRKSMPVKEALMKELGLSNKKHTTDDMLFTVEDRILSWCVRTGTNT